jgi:hypothetical protein
MKKTTVLLCALAFAVAAFAAGGWTAIQRGWGTQSVTAIVINDTDLILRAVTVRFEACGSKGSMSAGELAPGQSHRLRYSVCGEGGYTVEAEFADGQVVKGGGGYVESGYVSTERISRNGIVSSQAFY